MKEHRLSDCRRRFGEIDPWNRARFHDLALGWSGLGHEPFGQRAYGQPEQHTERTGLRRRRDACRHNLDSVPFPFIGCDVPKGTKARAWRG